MSSEQDCGSREPLPKHAPIIHTSKGAQEFNIADDAYAISEEELKGMNEKSKNKEADGIELKRPTVGVLQMQDWHQQMLITVAAASTNSSITVRWLQQILTAKTWVELEDPAPLAQLGLKLAAAAEKILPDDLTRDLKYLRQTYTAKHQKLMSGRMIIWLLYDYMRLSDADNVYELIDLQKLTVIGDNLEKIKDDWQRILFCMRRQPHASELESALRRRLEDSAQFKMSMHTYMHMHPGDTKNYDALWSMLTRFLTEKRNKQNRDAHENRQNQKGKNLAPVHDSREALGAVARTQCRLWQQHQKCR